MYKNVLVPLDGSEFSECPLPHVQAITQGCQVANVTLLAVIEEPVQSFPEYGSESQITQTLQEQKKMQAQAMDRAEKYLAKASIRLSKENIDVNTDVIQAPQNQGVADTILEYSKHKAADLIIMSTHGRSGISRWAMGSVADKVVHGSAIPVLLVAPSGCRL